MNATTKTVGLWMVGLGLAGCGDTGEVWHSDSAGGELQLDEPDPEPESDSFVCEQIDILFVVDNSPSMADEQQNLADAVPGFVAAMREAFPEIGSVHVGVVDTDTFPGIGGTADPLDACPSDRADCGSCDYTLGALVDKPLSAIAGDSCDFSTGARWMDPESPAFADEFACAVTVGTDGNPVEQQAGALLAAVSDELTEGCNAGFVRVGDTSRLVTVLVSDEDDDHRAAPGPQGGSLGEPADWYDAMVDAVGGHRNRVIALGLLGGAPKFDDCAELSVGNEGAELTARLSHFVERFDGHAIGSVCGSDYAPFFRAALDAVKHSCTAHTPTFSPAED
jgi:hypothetical protein